jgi:acyl carrier protein
VAFIVIGSISPPVYACNETEVHRIIAEWAGVDPDAITPKIELDGLNGMAWPKDAPDLMVQIEERCGINIPKADYSLFARVEDIDDYLGDDFDEDEK